MVAKPKAAPTVADKTPYVYIAAGGGGMIVGEEMERTEAMFLLRYPAAVRKNPTGTGWVFEPVQLVEPGAPFWLYRCSLMGHIMMPKIMMDDYVVYIQAMTSIYESKK